MRLRWLFHLRYIITSNAKQWAENHPEGDDQDEWEMEHYDKLTLEIYITYF